MDRVFRWGILGGGGISAKFAADLLARPDAEVYALASRSGSFAIPAAKQYADYEAFAADPHIDAVYIGTIHPQHERCAEICLSAGKPVLCEKPVTMDAAGCERLVRLATQKNVFFMEAMWTRLIPASRRLVELCRTPSVGSVRYIQLTFGHVADPGIRRLFDPALGGGALLDIGVYGVHFANMLLGEHPAKVSATAQLNDAGVDTECALRLEYPGGAVAEMSFSAVRRLRNDAFVATENCDFAIPDFWRADRVWQSAPGALLRQEQQLLHDYPLEGNGYGYEAREVERCVRAGLPESPWITHRNSLLCMRTLDQVREQCGIRY